MKENDKKPESIYLGLGSNLGDRLNNLRLAVVGLKSGGLKVEAISSVYQTPPWGNEDQPEFMNLVVKGNFSGEPEALLNLALQTEIALGRIRAEKWGPRIIDIDLLLFGERHLKTDQLILPHPLLSERLFVLVPLAEINPGLIISGLNKTVKSFLDNYTDNQLINIKKIDLNTENFLID